MTSQDELRDRIAEFIDAALVAWNTDMDTQYSEGEYVAQAIIDEFGLTVEIEPGHDPRECGCSSRAYPAESRVVGKWEKQ